MPPHDGERVLHDAMDVRRRLWRLADEKLDWQCTVPYGAMDRAFGGLKAGREQRLDLIVRLIDRPHPPRFFLALAAQLHGGFGERGFWRRTFYRRGTQRVGH